MATPRLTFLWPFLFKPATGTISQHTARPAALKRCVQTTSRRRQEAVTQRYGTANEPPPHLTGAKAAAAAKTMAKESKDLKDAKEAKEAKDLKTSTKSTTAKNGRAKKEKTPTSKEEQIAIPPQVLLDVPASASESIMPKISAPPVQEEAQTQPIPPSPPPTAEEVATASLDGLDMPPPSTGPGSPKTLAKNPLETVLNMPSSDDLEKAQAPVYYHENASTNPEEHKPPHISTPPYVHHFDTFSLVKRLETDGWTQKQAITTMKAVRLILAENMDLAREGLVSKSNVENETYLFRAACSELRTEIQTKRKAEGERSRTERNQLQHEVDILGQRLTQEGTNLKDELKGMFDDRKMAIRNEQRSMESKIQELNYHITVALNSDSRSDVEGVRWVITKRAISALFICVAMVLGSLKYTSTAMQSAEEERKRLAAMPATNSSDNGNSQERKREEPFGGGEVLVQQGDNPAFVSLG